MIFRRGYLIIFMCVKEPSDSRGESQEGTKGIGAAQEEGVTGWGPARETEKWITQMFGCKNDKTWWLVRYKN